MYIFTHYFLSYKNTYKISTYKTSCFIYDFICFEICVVVFHKCCEIIVLLMFYSIYSHLNCKLSHQYSKIDSKVYNIILINININKSCISVINVIKY